MKTLSIIAVIVLAVGTYLYLNHPKGTLSKEVPDLTGKSVEQALEELKAFTPGEKRIVHRESSEPEATVIGQEPAPGDMWGAGNEIVLYVSKPVKDKEFHALLESLLAETESLIKKSPYANGKVAVVSGTLMGNTNVHFSQLELLAIEDLRQHLARKGIKIAEISREDWIFLKLPELGTPPLFENEGKVLILEVNVNPSPPMKEMRIEAWGYTFSKKERENTDIVSSIVLDYADHPYVKELYEQDPAYFPIPKGTKENPFRDIDELARVLVAEAVSSYPSGKSAAIDVQGNGAVSNKIIFLIRDAITHWLDGHMNIVPGREDFRRLVERLTWEKNQKKFNFSKIEPFKRAGIYILVDVMDLSPDNSMLRLSMRAFWLIGVGAGTKVRGLKAIGYVENKEPDPFDVKAKLNKTFFKTGDKAWIEVQPNGRSCFIWIFDFMADGKITLLFPRRKGDDNFFLVGERAKIPAEEDDYELKVHAKQARDRNEIRVVAVKKPVGSPKIEVSNGLLQVSQREYERWVYRIPEIDRKIFSIEYMVEK